MSPSRRARLRTFYPTVTRRRSQVLCLYRIRPDNGNLTAIGGESSNRNSEEFIPICVRHPPKSLGLVGGPARGDGIANGYVT